MSKTTYTDADVKKVLKSLFVEKKRVKELQEQVQSMDEQKESLQQELHETQSKVALDDPKLAERLDAIAARKQGSRLSATSWAQSLLGLRVTADQVENTAR